MTKTEERTGTNIKNLTCYLSVRNAQAAIDFYEQVFGARELYRLVEPSGRIGHAELELGPTRIMLASEYPEYGIQGPESWGGTSVAISLHVDDVDAMASRAATAGAIFLRPPSDQFYGERTCRLRDPFGHEWILAQKLEDISIEEIQSRFAALFSSGE